MGSLGDGLLVLVTAAEGCCAQKRHFALSNSHSVTDGFCCDRLLDDAPQQFRLIGFVFLFQASEDLPSCLLSCWGEIKLVDNAHCLLLSEAPQEQKTHGHEMVLKLL